MTKDSNIRTAGNGVKVDISRSYYDPDNTVIQNELKVLEFDGGFDTYQGGENYAKAFGKSAFVHAVDGAEKSLHQALGLSKDEGLKIIKETGQLDRLQEFNEGLFEFLKGVSAQTQITVKELVLALNDGIFFAIGIHAFRDHVLEDLGFLRKGCTVAGFDNGILGQNNDNPTKYSGNNILVKSRDDKIMILAMGSPLIWLMGMSENLALVVNTIDAFFAGHNLEDGGLPDGYLIMNALLRYKSVDEVIQNYREARMAVALSVTFADKNGGLISIEFNADQFAGNIILKPKAGHHFLAHTNHPRYSETYLTDTWFDGDKGKANRMLGKSFWRQEFAESWLGASADKDVKEIQHLFRTYPVLFPGSDGHDFRTTVSVIWNINEGAGYISPDRPDITDYERVSFDD
jgi:hypothetical protein